MARVSGGKTAAEVVGGIHRWTARHPEWRPGREEVASWALEAEDRLLLVDPLLPKKGDEAYDPIIAYLDDLAGRFDKLEILITIPYHTRSAEPLFERYWGRVATRIWGQPQVAKRFFYDTKVTEVPRTKAGESVPIVDGLVEAYTIGNPRRLETPYYVPSLRAIAFGDAIVGTRDGLRVWEQGQTSESWYKDRFLPTLQPLAALDARNILVTHGPGVISGGGEQLAAALDAPPVPDFL